MRKPLDRIKDFREIWEIKGNEEIVSLASECHNCELPFCESVINIKKKSVGCPLGCFISKICNLVKYGLWREAYVELIKSNPFPEFTSRVCKGLCEISCVNNKNDDPVKIRKIILRVIENAFENGWVEEEFSKVRKYKKISVIGSGPSGLAVAYALNKNGYEVTVYEKKDRIGGMLVYGIPPMKIDKSIVKRRIDLMIKSGIEFQNNMDIGRTVSSQDIMKKSDAVVLCIGCEEEVDINISGRRFKSVVMAKDYLSSNTRNLLDNGNSDYLASGKNVLVLGSGDTASECIATAIRQRAHLVATMDIKDMPPLKKTNSWPEYPNNLSNDYAYEEARAVMGLDPRSFNITIKEIAGDIDVRQAKSVCVRWNESEGMSIVTDEGNEKIFDVDLIILALGFSNPDLRIFDDFKVNHFGKRPVSRNYRTSNNKVFVCGDALNGASLVPKAIKDGLMCANEIMRSLK